MFKWYVKIYLSNGNIVYGYIEDDLDNSEDVAAKYFTGNANSFNGIFGMTGGNLLYKVGSIDSVEISAFHLE
ncbi:MAG: hypothetical protein ACRC1P_09770 [Cellulosilyticaceae bacterium]